MEYARIIILLIIIVFNILLTWRITCIIISRVNPSLKEALNARLVIREDSIFKFKEIQNWLSENNKKASYILGLLLGSIAFITRGSLILSVLIFVIVVRMPYILKGMSRTALSKNLGNHMYRIYRFLSNQISSGVKPMDAMKTVYNVPEDKELRNCLINLSARLELTNDIEESFKVFREMYKSMETESLYLSLKQGIDTGTTGDLLEKQEEYHFSKYLSRIQAETENSSYKAFIAALIFSIVICILFVIPLMMEAGNAVSMLSGR